MNKASAIAIYFGIIISVVPGSGGAIAGECWYDSGRTLVKALRTSTLSQCAARSRTRPTTLHVYMPGFIGIDYVLADVFGEGPTASRIHDRVEVPLLNGVVN